MSQPQLPWFTLLPLPLTLLLVPFVLVPVRAQVQGPECLPSTMKNWGWVQFTIPPLSPGSHYTGPSGPDDADICKCNSVTYSLISACAGCQKGVWISYEQWTANCTKISPVSTFPQLIPNDTRVPAWGFLGVSDSQPWDNVTACNFGGNPESVGTYRPPFAPQFSTGNAISAGATAGAIAGSVLLMLAAIGVVAWYYLRRLWRRRKLTGDGKSTSTERLTTEQHKGEYEIVPWIPDPDIKFYDPSDPRTYPKFTALSQSQSGISVAAMKTTTTVNTIQDSVTPQSTKSRPMDYTGLPEI
ncbi:hypothetical protein B0F90DRAFT_1688907 [Multifurca ochricompacta]|uniref:Transmembrane protein n=1 Tax=Multifurca ochricompacta TaxID=376703 RepID=A0AAD4MA22_9AGAM|nr:hypothetical protein B0F90DRAFT_1688907 [Multifurca ochricompacta]